MTPSTQPSRLAGGDPGPYESDRGVHPGRQGHRKGPGWPQARRESRGGSLVGPDQNVLLLRHHVWCRPYPGGGPGDDARRL